MNEEKAAPLGEPTAKGAPPLHDRVGCRVHYFVLGKAYFVAFCCSQVINARKAELSSSARKQA